MIPKVWQMTDIGRNYLWKYWKPEEIRQSARFESVNLYRDVKILRYFQSNNSDSQPLRDHTDAGIADGCSWEIIDLNLNFENHEVMK